MVVKQYDVPFEDALRIAGFGKFNLLALALCTSLIMGTTFEIYSVSFLVPSSACELKTTSAQQGMMAAVPLIGIIALSSVWGYLADTQGRRKILVITMVLSFVSGSLASLSPNWIVFSLLKFCSSAAVSGTYALSLTLLSECTPIARRSLFILLTTSMTLISNGIMAVLSIAILPLQFSYHIPYLDIYFNSWRLLCIIFAVPSAVGAIGIACSYESPKYLLSIGENEKALKILMGIFVVNSGKSSEMYRVGSVQLNEESSALTKGFWKSIQAQTTPMFKPPYLKDTILIAMLFFIVYFCVNPFMVWLPFIVNAFMSVVSQENVGSRTICEIIRMSNSSSTGNQEAQCSMDTFGMTIVFGCSLVLALLNMIVSGLNKNMGRKQLFIGLQVVSGAAAILVVISKMWQISVVLIIVYMSSMINFGTMSSICVDVYPTFVKAMAVCFTLMLGRGSSIISINLIKRLLDDNCEAAFYIFGIITVVGGVIGFLLPSDKKLAEGKETAPKISEPNT